MAGSKSGAAHDKFNRPVPKFLAALVFASRWLQAPMYIGLTVATLMYLVQFLRALWDGFYAMFFLGTLEEIYLMLMVLNLIDMVMIVNLLAMVIIGGYETFVSKLHVHNHPDEPDWLAHINANVLKVKFASSIVVISLVHLLSMFALVSNMDYGKVVDDSGHVLYTPEGLKWDLVIHMGFIVTAVSLAFIDWLGKKGNAPHAQHGAGRAGDGSRAVAAASESHAGDVRSAVPGSDAPRLVTVELPADAPLPPGARIVSD